jgi:hypothetical protein
MIQLTELRKNNLVLHEGKIKTVEAIGYDKISVSGKYVNPDEIYPVELTEELLLKCSAYNCFGDLVLNLEKARLNFIFYGGLSHQLDIYQDEKHISMSSDCCNYLHKLQNLYYPLTGKELEINI